jgi:hypothetical protein
MNNELPEVYNKALKVIDSCETLIQLKNAIQYVHNFKDHFLKTHPDNVLVMAYHKSLEDFIKNKTNEIY